MTDQKNNIVDLLKDVPEAIGSIHKEATTIGKSLLQSSLKKTEIVTRKEFEEQKEILEQICQKIDQLEQIILNRNNLEDKND